MSSRSDVLLWAQRVIARKAAAPHEILELPANAGPDVVQEAFHKIARTAHPDLHRKGLTPEELERITSAYAICAGAYQTFRTQTAQTQRMRPAEPAGGSGQTPPAGTPSTRPTPVPAAPSQTPATPAGPAPGSNAAQSMSSKALVYYRKAELALKRGDLKGAVLQIKLAIAADPASGFLRTALAEVELEVRKGS